MAVLRPLPLGALVRRMFREWERRRSIFDLPERSFFPAGDLPDLSVRFHGASASTPLGPAAGPHSQMAQNLVLAWLAGSRILELKTIQVLDALDIPRPCIDLQTVGYNIEWSQELSLDASLREYVKGAMLVEMLRASGELPAAAGRADTIWDVSVGYDLEGIRSGRVQAFLRGMRDARPVVDELRREIPAEWRRFRDLDYPARLARTVTLSTFHGCPPEEIERIAEFLLEEHRLHCTVKLNPTLLGRDEVRRLLHDLLGYRELVVPGEAFERDTKWEEMSAFVERLAAKAARAGLGFGVKFSNTLVVENHRRFFPPSQKRMYLSGQPLHVLAMHLVARFRERFGARIPISFAAGIDRANFAEAVALGLVPVTVCSDLLRPGGYARQGRYLGELAARMRAAGAATEGDWVIRAFGHGEEALRRAAAGREGREVRAARAALRAGGDLGAAAGPELHGRWVEEAALLNTRTYVERASAEPRYRRERTSKVPRKIGRRLELFDCISCDKCLPVCPNAANFTFALPRGQIPGGRLRRGRAGWELLPGEPIRIEQEHQIGNFADFCNDCGNCDVFCPEDGGPYAAKPRFFGSEEAWRADGGDGFFLGRSGPGRVRMLGRFGGREYLLEAEEGGERVRWAGEGFDLAFDPADPASTAEGECSGEVDLARFHVMERLRRALLADPATNWVNAIE